jgi:hypothetical protein
MDCDHTYWTVWGLNPKPLGTELSEEEADEVIAQDQIRNHGECDNCGLSKNL